MAFWISFLYIVSTALMLTTHPQAELLRLPHSLGRILIHHWIYIIVKPALNIPQSFFNAKKALITSENTTHPILPFQKQSLEFHFLQTSTQKPARWISKVHPPKWLASFQKNPSRLNYLPLLCLASYVSIPSQSPEQIIRTLTTDNSLQTGKVIITISLTNTQGFLPTRSRGQVWLLFPFYIF